jgi:hypothetical protein
LELIPLTAQAIFIASSASTAHKLDVNQCGAEHIQCKVSSRDWTHRATAVSREDANWCRKGTDAVGKPVEPTMLSLPRSDGRLNESAMESLGRTFIFTVS